MFDIAIKVGEVLAVLVTAYLGVFWLALGVVSLYRRFRGVSDRISPLYILYGLLMLGLSGIAGTIAAGNEPFTIGKLSQAGAQTIVIVAIATASMVGTYALLERIPPSIVDSRRLLILVIAVRVIAVIVLTAAALRTEDQTERLILLVLDLLFIGFGIAYLFAEVGRPRGGTSSSQ